VPRKSRVEVTAAAERDLEGILEYIAQDDPVAATAFVSRLEEQIGTLELFPERCPPVPENQLLGTSYRHLIHGHYRTIFRISDRRVIILRVLHEAQLLEIAGWDE
jgi:toxin ParE1/3/4